MELRILNTTKEAGIMAAEKAANLLREAVASQGFAKLMLSTGASQFEFFNTIINMDIPWESIDIFHLDEYVGIPDTHPASFSKYIKERLVNKIKPKSIYLIDGTKNAAETVADLNKLTDGLKFDVAMIGIGVNAHIAFNDPPADFTVKESFHIVELDDECKRQQVGEGWFETVDDVPKQAVSATVNLIRSSKNILSLVPHKVKAKAVKSVLESNAQTPDLPATALLDHPSWSVYLDAESASLLDLSKVKR